jgi:O-antigen/teichoic acid export membrane protein
LRRARGELIAYCVSLTAWSLAMLMITGADVTIVGIFDFGSVAAFGVAANLVAFFLGLIRAVLSPLIQVFARLNARGDQGRLLALFDVVSRATTIGLVVTSCWMALPADAIFRAWVGPQIARTSVPIFVVLIFANAIRNSGAPYANYLLAVGEQRKVYLSPLLEGAANLVVSVGLAAVLGAIGVAWGTIVGAIVGVGVNFLYNFRRTMPPGFATGRYVLHTALEPLLAALPMIALLVASDVWRLPLLWSAPAMLLATVPSAVSIVRLFYMQQALVGAAASLVGDERGSQPVPGLLPPA